MFITVACTFQINDIFFVLFSMPFALFLVASCHFT